MDYENGEAINIVSRLGKEAVDFDKLRIQLEVEMAFSAVSYLAHHTVESHQGFLLNQALKG